MEKQEIQLSTGKSVVVTEIKYSDFVSSSSPNANPNDATMSLVMLSTGLTEDEYKDLSLKDGLKVQKCVNDINGLTADFLSKTPQENDSLVN